MYKILIDKKCEKYLNKLDRGDKVASKKIVIFLDLLKDVENPKELANAKKLQGYKQEFYRWKIGNYRIVGEVKDNELLIKIIEIGTRENFYNKLK